MKKLSVALLLIVCVVTVVAYAPVSNSIPTYSLGLLGPRYFDGSAVNGSVTVSVYWSGYSLLLSNPTIFTMTSNGTVMNSTVLTNTSPPSQVTWNSSSLLNYTSTYDFTPAEAAANPTISIGIPSPNMTSAQYGFSISDLGANMVNPFLRIGTTLAGHSFTVESRNLNASGTVYFALTQYQPYVLSIVCDQGTYSQNFFSENVFQTNLPVMAGSFPLSVASTFPTLEASRLNSTLIGISYTDSTYLTDWLSYTISHKMGADTVTDYTGNTTGNSQTILWNNADPNFAYSLSALASVNSTLYSWDIAIPQTATANPFMGAFDWLGKNTLTLPHYYVGWPNGMTSPQIAQLVGVAVIMLFLGIGSYKNAGASCIIAWLAGGIMIVMGWYNGGASQAGASGIPLFAFGGFLALLIHFQEKKAEGAGLG